ncbi:MAG: multifunctional oxoglutarate decarboxylase/oxoglutarate dehydrogenase thiamine pyrophosphate-binding subunit/dihydrolipoyllysine-residue succinyltransferase subunit, partial [Actinomycetota bacterium]|nr:multifunctional oxoglutarate decarboxylase/oxoglutarate dehydrogenase thiamine pyrophosphate-binding subunit/dihydrolipoyllysine-residue succinyltransferase subunit [Actinomycetota bacterium]
LLRRQALRANRKPLVVMTPKSLLRLPAARSTAEQLTAGQFAEVLPDPEQSTPDRVRRVLLCTGKVYYELAKRRRDEELGELAILRVEQLYPFPAEALRAQLDAYPNAERTIWVQEEPENMGAWRYVRLKAEEELGVRLESASRAEGAAPAAGSPTLHQQEQQELLDRAFAGLR